MTSIWIYCHPTLQWQFRVKNEDKLTRGIDLEHKEKKNVYSFRMSSIWKENNYSYLLVSCLWFFLPFWLNWKFCHFKKFTLIYGLLFLFFWPCWDDYIQSAKWLWKLCNNQTFKRHKKLVHHFNHNQSAFPSPSSSNGFCLSKEVMQKFYKMQEKLFQGKQIIKRV